MRNGHGLPVACSAPPPQSAVATNNPDGCQQTQQDEVISFGENDEVEEDSDSQSLAKNQKYEKSVSTSVRCNAEGMMPPSEETNTANCTAQNTCSNPNISSSQCGLSSTHNVKDSELTLSSAVCSSAIKDLLTSTFFSVNTKSVVHQSTEKSKKGKNIVAGKGIATRSVSESKIWTPRSNFSSFEHVKRKVQPIRSIQHSDDLNTYTDISSVSSGGLSSDDDSVNEEDDNFEQFLVNDVGAINLVKGECSKSGSSDGLSHHWTARATKVSVSQVVADESIQSAPLCLTVNKRPETQLVKPPPARNYGLVLQQPSTFRHVSNPVSYSAFAPKYPARWPLLHIPFHSSGFRGRGIVGSGNVHLRDEHLRPQAQRRHSCDTKFPYDSDTDDLSSSDSDSSEDDLLPLFSRVRASSEMNSQQVKQQELVPKLQSSEHCSVQEKALPTSPLKIASQDTSVLSQPCSVSKNVVQSVLFNDGNVITNSAVEKCSEPSSNDHVVDITTPLPGSDILNVGSSASIQLAEISGSCNKVAPADHWNGVIKSSILPTHNAKKTKPKRLTVAKVSSGRCAKKKLSEAKNVQNGTPLMKSTCSKINTVNGCHSVCSVKEGSNKEIDDDLGRVINNKISNNSEDLHSVLTFGEGTCTTATICSTVNEVSSSQMCDSTSCSSQDMREEALKVVTHCLKDLLFRVVSFPSKSTINTTVASVVSPMGVSKENSFKKNSVENETGLGKVSCTSCNSNEKHCNTSVKQTEEMEEKYDENDVSSTCVDASNQFSQKSTKSVQVEMKNDEPSMLGEILQATFIPNIIHATRCFINHECEMSTHSLGLLDGDKLLSIEVVNSQNSSCTDSSQNCTSLSLPDSSNNLTKHDSLDKSCEISPSDLGLPQQKFSVDDIALAKNVEEKCLMIQRSLNRKKFGTNDAICKKGENCVFTRTLSVTGVTCSLPLSKVSLALADCMFASDTACVSKSKHSDNLLVNCCMASANSHGSNFELVGSNAKEEFNYISNEKYDDTDDARLQAVNLSVQSVSSSAQTDISYQNSFTSLTEVPSKFLFQVQPVHHMKLGDGQKLYACDICSGVYQRSFSLKRHYLRSHINYRHLTERDISNCGIIVGDKMAVQTGTNTKIYMQNSRITSQQLDCKHHETHTNKNVCTDSKSVGMKPTTVIHNEQNESNSISVINIAENCENNLPGSSPIESLLKEDKLMNGIKFPALYRCHFCGICFDVKEHLKSHLLNHPPAVTGISKETNSYVCDICSLVFTHKHNYLRHCASENHKNASKPQSHVIKEHLCLYCDKGFKTSAIRKRHQSRMHHYFSKQKRPGKRPFHPCSYCPSASHKFKDLTILVKHMIASHPDKYHGCLACSERFDCRDAFNSHVDIFHKKNKSKVLKGAEVKVTKSSNVPLKITANSEENDLTMSVPVLKTLSEEQSKTPTKKTPDKKLVETAKEPTIIEGKNNGGPKPLNSSNANNEFRYTCGVCQKMFTNYVNMCRHRRLAHGTITAKSKKIKKSVDSSETSGTCSTSSQSSESRSESPAVASKAPADLSNKAQGTAQVVQPTGTLESQMDPETLFYSKIAINIRDNLLNHLDGKLHDNNNTIPVTKENKAICERSIATDRPKRGEKSILKVDCGSTNSQSRELNSVDGNERKQSNNSEKSKVSSKRGHIHKVPWEKYNFPKNYDGKGDGLASYIKDMSHLDISTQLVMQQNLQRVNSSAGSKCKDSLPHCPESDESIQDSDFPKGLCLMQRNFSSALSDVFSTTRHESTLTRACSSSSVPSLLNSKDTLTHSNFTRRKSLSDIKIPSTNDSCLGRPVSNDLGKDVELSGEWVRPRSYICGACSERFADLYDLEDHKYAAHPNVWCTHFEFEESTITGVSFDRSRCHASFPGNLSRRYLNVTGTLHVADVAPSSSSSSSVDSECTKCSKNFNSVPELHRHILDCGGDTTWMLTMVAATSSGSRRNRKWRPFGSRRRRHQGRRGMKRNIPSSPIKLPQYRVRHRGTDSDSIQRMIANLPAKRASRRVIQFSEDEVKTRSQGTVHCNRILRKRFKVSTLIPSMHLHKSWGGRSSTVRGITFPQCQKMASAEARSSKTIQNIHRMSSELTASKLLRSSRNFLQNKPSSKAVKDVIRSFPGHQSHVVTVADQKTKLLEKEPDIDNSAPKTRNMTAKKMGDDDVATLSSKCKVKRSRFVRKSVINNIKSKYRNSVQVLSGETLSSKYRTTTKKMLGRRKTNKNVSVPLSGTEMAIPRRSGRTSVLREKISVVTGVSSVDLNVSTVETNIVNNCKLTSQTPSKEDNEDCKKTLGENIGEQKPINNTALKDDNVKLEKRKQVRKLSAGEGNKAKAKTLNVSNKKTDTSETAVKEVSCKDCSVICNSNLCSPLKEGSTTQNKMVNYIENCKKILTPRMCLSCGKKFKVINTLEKHLKKCGPIKSVGKINSKLERRYTRTQQNDAHKNEMTKKKGKDENMPELQKEEPLEVLPITDSSKKCDEITHDIPVLSPVSQDTVIHTINSCNDEKKCAGAAVGLRSKRKSKRQKRMVSDDFVISTEKMENCEQISSSLSVEKILTENTNLQYDKSNVTGTASTPDQDASSSDCKTLKKVPCRRKGRVNNSFIASAKYVQDLSTSTVMSSDVPALQVVMDSAEVAELSKTKLFKSNTDDIIDITLAQRCVTAGNKKKDSVDKKKFSVEKKENVQNVVNRNSKKTKKINLKENALSIADPDRVTNTGMTLDKMKNSHMNIESKHKGSRVGGQQIKPEIAVVNKSNCSKKFNQLRSSKRLSKIVSDNINVENISSYNSSFTVKKDELEVRNNLKKTSDAMLEENVPLDKITASLVECCKDSQSNCECSSRVIPRLSQEEVSTICMQPNSIEMSSKSLNTIINGNKECENMCSTETTSILAGKIDFEEEIENINITQTGSHMPVLLATKNDKGKQIVLKDFLEIEDNSSIGKDEKVSERGKKFSDRSSHGPDVLNEVNNDPTSSKRNIQSKMSKRRQCVLNKKSDRIPDSARFGMNRMLKELLTSVDGRKFDKTNSKNNENYCFKKLGDSKETSTQNVNISEVKIDATDFSDVIVHSEPVVGTFGITATNDLQIRGTFVNVSDGVSKLTRRRNKLAKEQCEFLPQESARSCDGQQSPEVKSVDWQSNRAKSKISTVNNNVRRKFKFPKIKSSTVPECNFKNKRQRWKKNFLNVKSDEGTLNVAKQSFESVKCDDTKASCTVVGNKSVSIETEVSSKVSMADITKQISTTELDVFSSSAGCLIETQTVSEEIKNFSDPVFDTNKQLKCEDTVQVVREENFFETLIEKPVVTVILDNVVGPSLGNESICCTNKEHRPNETILRAENIKGGPEMVEVSTFTESSLDADEDMLPIAKLREISLRRVRALNRLSINSRKVKKGRKHRMKTAEIKHLEIKPTGRHPNVTNSSPCVVNNAESGNFLKIQEETKLHAKGDVDLCDGSFKCEENLSLAGNRLLRARRNNSLDKTVLSHFERRESRARSTRWNLSYEEMYTSSDIASEADSQDFDSNQKENKSVLRGHHRRKCRRMRTAKPRNNVFRQDKKRRKSLRRLTVLRNQRKAEMRLETKAYKSGEILLPECLANDDIQEGFTANVKMTLTEDVFNSENLDQVALETKYVDMVIESATEEETVSEITKTAVINKVFCKKPKKINVSELKAKENYSAVLDGGDTERSLDILPTAHMESSLEKFLTFTNKSLFHEKCSSLENKCNTGSVGSIDVKENRSSSLVCKSNFVVEEETSNSTQVTKQVYEMPKTSGRLKVSIDKNLKSTISGNVPAKKKGIKEIKCDTVQKRKKPKQIHYLNRPINMLDQMSGVVLERFLDTAVDSGDHISKSQHGKVLPYKSAEISVELNGGTQSCKTRENMTAEEHDFNIINDTHLILNKILELADAAAKDDTGLKEKLVCANSNDESTLSRKKSAVPREAGAISGGGGYLLREEGAQSLDHFVTVQHEVIMNVESSKPLVQQQLINGSLINVEDSCDTVVNNTFLQKPNMKPVNSYNISNHFEQKEPSVKYSHYCKTCKKYYSSSSNLIKHKLSVFHKRNVSLEVSGDIGSTSAPGQHSSMSDKFATTEHHQDGNDAYSSADKSSDLKFIFSDEVPLSVIAKHIRNSNHKQRKAKKLTAVSNFNKKTALKNKEKIKDMLIHRKKKLFGKFKRKLLRERGFVKEHAASEVRVTSDYITDLHENCTSHQIERLPSFSSLDGSKKLEEKEKSILTVTFSDEPGNNILPQLVGETFMNDRDMSKIYSPNVVSEEHLHQPTSLAVLASRNIEKDLLDSINGGFITPLNNLKFFKDTSKIVCSVPMEIIKNSDETRVTHSHWQPSLKSIFTLPSSFKELCFDSVLLSEVETQGTVAESENFNVEPSTLQDLKTDPVMPRLNSKLMQSNKDYNCKEQVLCGEELKNNIPSSEIQIPMVLESHIQGPTLNEVKPPASNSQEIVKLSWPNILKIPPPQNCEEQNMPVQLSEDQHTLSLELELEDSLIIQESSKTIQDNVCTLQPSQSPSPVFIEPVLQPSLLQEATSNSLEIVKHVQGKIQNSDVQLNFLQMYEENETFPEEFESERILLEPETDVPVVETKILQNSESQEKIVVQNMVLKERNCKLSAVQNFDEGIPKLGKTKAYIPEKLQVQLPLLKIRDVQFLLAHNADIQRTTYEDSDSQQSLPEASDIKDARQQQSSHTVSAFTKSLSKQVENEASLSDMPLMQLEKQTHTRLSVEKKCEDNFSSSNGTEESPSTLGELKNDLHMPCKTVPQASEIEGNKLCTYETELSHQPEAVFDCSSSLLVTENNVSQVDNYISRIPLQQEPVCSEVTNLTNTLQLPTVQESKSEYRDSVISVKNMELGNKIETCEVQAQLLDNLIPIPSKSVTQQEYNPHLNMETQSVTKQSEPSENEIHCQNCEITTTVDEETKQSDGEKENPMQSTQEILIPVPVATKCVDKSLPKYSQDGLCYTVGTSNSKENKLWEHKNNSCDQTSVSETQMPILGSDSPWSQDSDKGLASANLAREQISDDGPILNESLCDSVFEGPSHKEFDVSPTLNASEMPEDTGCIQKSVVNVSSHHHDPYSNKVSEMSQNITWSHKSDTSEAIKENLVEQPEIEYSSLHRLAEVVLWSQNRTASPVLESALCGQTKIHAALKMPDELAWSHKIDSHSVLHDSSHDVNEISSSEDHVNWPQKERNVNIIYQDSSGGQLGTCSSLTEISDAKVVWSQNNEMCLPVLPDYSCEQVDRSSLKDSESSYTWSQNQETRIPVLQNLTSEQNEVHPPSLQISEPNVTVSQENENCLSVLQTLSSEQNEICHSSVNVSENNLSWTHTHKPGHSLSQSREHEIQQSATKVPDGDLPWSQKESTAALQDISLVKDGINIIVTDTQLAQPQTNVVYTFTSPSDHNSHQASYPDPEFDVCLPRHPEVVTCVQQEYSFENVNVHPQLQSNTRNHQLQDQSSYASIHQSPSSEERTTVLEVQSPQAVFQKSTADEFVNQFSSLGGGDSSPVPRSQQEHVLKKLPLQLLKVSEVEHSLPQEPEVTAELLKESSIAVPLGEDTRTQVDSCAKLLNSEVHTTPAQDCENQELRYSISSEAWCGRESGNWPNEQIQNSAGWSGQGELNSNSGWTEWVAGNMNWSQHTAPHFYSSTAPVPVGGSLGSIIDSVNQILNEENTVGSNSSRVTHVASDYTGFEALPAGCVVPRGLEELQRAMGATDEEMLMLQKLGENCCWPLENAEIMDLDGNKKISEKDNTTQKNKETEKTTVNNQAVENVAKKAVVSVSRRQRAEDRPFGHNQSILSQYESKEMVCPVCNKHFLGLTALQTHVTSAHNLDQAADRKAKATERSRQALISSIACTSLLQLNSSRHMCTTCKELHMDEESLKQHVEAMHNEDVSIIGTEDSQEPRKSIVVNDQKAEGLKSQMSTALGGLLNRALSSVFISRLSKEIAARADVDSLPQSPENGGTQRSQGTGVSQEKQNPQLKGETDDTKEMLYVCDLCDLKFNHLGSKNRHVQTVHLKMPRNLSLGDTVPNSSVSSTGYVNSKDEHENESGWVSESPPEWAAEPNMDGEILDGSFLCQDCGINFQTPQEVLSHRQLEHSPPESQSQSVSDGKELLASDKTSLIDCTDGSLTVPENIADSSNSCADGVMTVIEGSLSVEDVPDVAATHAKLSNQIVCEKTVEKLLFSSCLGRISEATAKKVAKSKINIEELEKQLCRNDAIIKAKAEAAIRELSLTRKGRNSAANTRWGVQRYKFVVPDRHPSTDKTREKVVLPADDRYSYPLIRKVSNSRFASLTERKKKLGSKSESFACDKVVGKGKLEKEVNEPDSTCVDVYEFDDDDSATKEISLRGVVLPLTGKNIVQSEGHDVQIISGKDCVSVDDASVETCLQTVVSAEHDKAVLLPSLLPHDKLNMSEVQQQELGSESACSDPSGFLGGKVTNKEETHTNEQLQYVTVASVTEVVDKPLSGALKESCSENLGSEGGEKPEVKECVCPKSDQNVGLDLVDDNSSAKHLVKNKKDKLGTNSKVGRKQKTSNQGSGNKKESKPMKLQKKRKSNASFEMPPSKHTPQTDSNKSETQEIMPLGRRQVKKVSYVELYDSEVDDQFLFYSDDEVGSVDNLKAKPKCKSQKKKQSKPDKKKRKSDQPVVQQGETCSGETVTHAHKKRCKQKLQSVDISSSVPKCDDCSATCRTDSPVFEASKFHSKWLHASEPVTDEDNTSESDQSDKQKTTKTDLLKTVFAKSRRNSTTIVSGSGGTVPEIDDGRSNTHSVKHKHRS